MELKSRYLRAFREARDTKKEYFRDILDRYNRRLLETVDDGSWSMEERRAEYRTKVLPYWEKYGCRPEQFWYDLNCSRDRRMDPRFIPSVLYYNEILPYLNNLSFKYALQDKSTLDIRFKDVKQAETVCRRMAGVYYDAEMEVIPCGTAVKLCLEREGDLFIKPSLYSGSGIGIQKFTPSVCGEEKIKDIFSETGHNFIVQEKIIQHESLNAINPDSVCTVRLLSLFAEDTVHVIHTMIRVGLPGSSHVSDQGGYCAEILEDGHLHPKAFRDEEKWLDAKAEGLYDYSVVIPCMDIIKDEVKRLHPRIGHFKWIGWDFTVDEDMQPLMIEFNTAPGDDVQRVCGRPLFGEMTDWVLEDFYVNRTMEGNKLNDMWCACEDIRRY